MLYGDQPRLPEKAEPSATDVDNSDTLRVVRSVLAQGLADIDKWHAFDLTGREGLTMKQQVEARKLAYQILVPLLDAVDSAMEQVNRKYRRRNNG